MKNKLSFLSLFLLILASGSTLLFAGGGGERYTTDVNTSYIMNYLNSGNLDDEREGIYLQSNGGNNPYLLAIAKNMQSGEFYAIYLSGPGGLDWNEGDIKAIFRQNGRSFRGTWYSRSGVYGDNAEITFYDNSSFMVEASTTFIINTYYFSKIMPYATGFARERGSTGTGFLLNRDGYVVTNYHVIENKNYILVRGINGEFSRAYLYTPVLIDMYNDIAILKPEVTFLSFNNPPYSFMVNEAPQGSSVFALGYPMRGTMGDEIKLTDGIISALSGVQGNPNAYQTTATVSPGNSGGPLFDENGNVIGINASILTSNLTRNVNYAIKIRYVVNLINNSNFRINMPSISDSSDFWRTTSTLAERTARVRNFVYMIEAF
jgi:S1-C subfamily serine protease